MTYKKKPKMWLTRDWNGYYFDIYVGRKPYARGEYKGEVTLCNDVFLSVFPELKKFPKGKKGRAEIVSIEMKVRMVK